MAASDDLDKTHTPLTSAKPRGPDEATRPHAAATLPQEAEGRYAVPQGVTDPELGRGGMGRVLHLSEVPLARDVAVKELLPQHHPSQSTAGPALVDAFVREARVLARLEHPGVVPIYELGQRADGSPYYSMRKVRGRPLADALAAAASLDERLALLPHLIDVAHTVGYAHARRTIHRDLKPANVMIGDFGETLVMDWGLAVVDGEDALGVTAGTPAYMSPEQARGERVGPQSDVFSLGVMLFEALTGRLPFDGETASQLVLAVQTQPAPRADALDRAVPRALADVVERCLRKRPDDRYATGEAVAEALERAQHARRRALPVAWVVAAACALLALAGLWWGRSGEQALDAERRVLSRIAAESKTQRAQALAELAREKLRGKDVSAAAALAQRAQDSEANALAFGVELLTRALPAPTLLWSVKTVAGCSALAVADQQVACASLNGAQVYALADGADRPSLDVGPKGWQRAVVATKDGWVTAGDDRSLHFFPRAGGPPVRSVGPWPDVITAVAFGAAGPLVGLLNGQVLDADGGVLAVHAGPARVVAHGRFRASGGGRTVEYVGAVGHGSVDRASPALWVSDEGQIVLGAERALVFPGPQPRTVETGHTDVLTALAAGQWLVTGGADGTVRWHALEGGLVGVLSGFGAPVQALAVARGDADVVVVATRDRKLEAYRLPRRPATAAAPHDDLPLSFALEPKGWVLAGAADGRVRRRLLDGSPDDFLELTHRGPVRALAVVPGKQGTDGFRHVSGGADGQLLAQRWNGQLDVLVDGGAEVRALAVSPDGARLAVAWGDGALGVGSLGGSLTRTALGALGGCVAFSPDGGAVAVGRDDKRVSVHAGAASAPKMLEPFDAPPTALAFAPDGTLVVGAADGTASLWDVAQGRVLRRWPVSKERITSVDVQANGRLAALGADDGSAYLVDLGTGRLLAELALEAGDVGLVRFLGSEQLVVAGTDRTLLSIPLRRPSEGGKTE